MKITIHSYEEGDDTFEYSVEGREGERFTLPGELFPTMTGVYGDFSEIVGNSYPVEMP
jgi:hypothetical protein